MIKAYDVKSESFHAMLNLPIVSTKPQVSVDHNTLDESLKFSKQTKQVVWQTYIKYEDTNNIYYILFI